MGYELERFIEQIHEEYLCSICDLVAANPVQSSLCEHLYCTSCINGWRTLDQTCPEDGTSLKLKGAPKLIQSLLSKLWIKCDFYEDGCRAIVTLENLPEHVDTCNYDPNAEIVCDRGCNLTMLRHEYNASSCLEHQKAEIDKVFARTFSRSRPNHQGEDDVFNLIDEIILDNWEEVDMDIDVVKDAKWQVFHNMKESADQDDQSNILECDTKSCYAFAQSFSFLETTKPYFRIEIVNLDCVKYVAIGLTSKDHPIDKIPGLHTGSLGYDNTGDLIVHNKCKNVDLRWKVGDIIECGIKFPSNFTNDGSTGVTLYFSRNKKLIAEENVKMPIDGFLPTVYMYEGIVGSMLGSGNVWSSNTSTKVKYFNN